MPGTDGSASVDCTVPSSHASQHPRLRRLSRQFHLFPRRFWLLVTGTLLYLVAISLAFPYTPILLERRLHLSLAGVGLVMGGAALAGLPLQPFAGSLSDRYGRRAVMLGCAACETISYLGLAFAHGFWPICVLVFIDRGLGWPLFLTASNAMVADLVRPRLRPQGYSLVRLMIGAGYVVGPLLAAAVLALGAPLETLFLIAGSGCLAYLGFVLFALKETHPRAVHGRIANEVSEGAAPFGALSLFTAPGRLRARERRRARRRPGWGRVLADRRFLAFCAVSLLPLFIFGQVYTTYPVLLTSYRHLPAATWGLLVSFIGLVIVLTQYPSVRALRRLDPLHQVAFASLLFGLGVGLVAFVPLGWPLLVTVAALALAQALFGPLSTAIVSRLASADLRGRYMGVWTLVWMTGATALGPLLGGLMLATLGPRGSCVLVIALSLAAAGLYAWLRARGRPRKRGAACSSSD
jgi:MFS family permease